MQKGAVWFGLAQGWSNGSGPKPLSSSGAACRVLSNLCKPPLVALTYSTTFAELRQNIINYGQNIWKGMIRRQPSIDRTMNTNVNIQAAIQTETDSWESIFDLPTF